MSDNFWRWEITAVCAPQDPLRETTTGEVLQAIVDLDDLALWPRG